MIVLRPARRPRRRLRAWSLALLVLGVGALALTPLVAAHHRATHVHVVCEHGDQIELEPSTTVAPLPPSERSIDQRGAATTGTENHQHCTQGCAATAVVVARPAVALATVVARAAIPRPPAAILSTRDVLIEAPKTSPPV